MGRHVASDLQIKIFIPGNLDSGFSFILLDYNFYI